jgi:hypothetical protein
VHAQNETTRAAGWCWWCWLSLAEADQSGKCGVVFWLGLYGVPLGKSTRPPW